MDGLVELPAGAQLRDRYRIVREIGRGERSIVYEALDTRDQRSVALKLLSPPAATAHLLRGRIEREMERVRAIDHAGVVGAEEVFDLDGAIAIVAERVHGSDLESQIRANGALPAELIVPIGCQLAEILARYGAAVEVFWVQEEPRNMGAWDFLDARVLEALGPGCSLHYVGRPWSASPSAGSHLRHEAEQKLLIQRAFEGVQQPNRVRG